MSIFTELRRRKVFRTVGAYVVGAWVLIQVVETVFPAFGLDDELFRLLVTALALGVVPVAILSWAYELTAKPERSKASADPAPPTGAASEEIPLSTILRRKRFAVPFVAALLLIGAAITLMSLRMADADWARTEALPEAQSMAEEGNFMAAIALAEEIEAVTPDDPVLAELWDVISARVSFTSEPSGATVAWRPYAAADDAPWTVLGRTPVDGVRLPRSPLHWRVTLDGYETIERTGNPSTGTMHLTLVPGQDDHGLVRVASGMLPFLLVGYTPPFPDPPDYRIQRFEVTHAEYLEFVEDGGYARAEFWAHLPIKRDGETVEWQDAVAEFEDRTGRPGPSTWVGGRPPEGQADYPVNGVSWFEAAAYARYRGLELPTVYHWSQAAIDYPWLELEVAPKDNTSQSTHRTALFRNSRFGSDGPGRVGARVGRSFFGVIDVAGNVREWCWNATPGEAKRYILGGAWDDPGYLFTYAIAESPWNRSPKNGIRLAEYDPAGVADLRETLPLPRQETIEPVSDEVFAVYRDLFDYDRTDLDVVIEGTDDSSPHWTRQTVSFDTSYDDRMMAHVYLPRDVEPPYQVVVYYPTSNAIYADTSDAIQIRLFDFIVQSGRAVVHPVLAHTYERHTGLVTTWPDDSKAYSNRVVRWIQDFRRTVDYLETRNDMALDQLAYYGFSWGGWNGPIVLALDDRFATGVFVSGGIPPTLARPEASSASYASRVQAPVLMISGRNDELRPVATFMQPMFESLGTHERLKRHAILEGGHVPERQAMIRETLAWFDRYLGEVK